MQQFEVFTAEDVQNLMANPTETVKIELINKLHHNFKLDNLQSGEKNIAEEILRYLAADISVRIRESISTKFADNNALPHDIALKLANDMEDMVAVPVIQKSPVLAEQDIINVITNGNVTRQSAVANRSDLNDNLCAHIIYQAKPEAIGTLINNKNINISAGNAEVLIKNHAQDQVLMKLMINNKKISLEQAHNLLTSVSEDLRKMLIVEYQIPSTVVNNLVHESKEWMILNLIIAHAEKHPNSLPLRQIIDKLHDDGELSFSILVKALGLGDMSFFEAAIARLGNIPVENAQILLNAADNHKSFAALYNKCALPESMLEAIYKMMEIVREERRVENMHGTKIHHRILNRLSRASNSEKVENLDYLVTIVAYNLRKSNLL